MYPSSVDREFVQALSHWKNPNKKSQKSVRRFLVPPQLDYCWLKMERAREHRNALDQYFNSRLSRKENLPGIDIEVDPDTNEGVIFIKSMPERGDFKRKVGDLIPFFGMFFMGIVERFLNGSAFPVKPAVPAKLGVEIMRTARTPDAPQPDTRGEAYVPPTLAIDGDRAVIPAIHKIAAVVTLVISEFDPLFS